MTSAGVLAVLRLNVGDAVICGALGVGVRLARLLGDDFAGVGGLRLHVVDEVADHGGGSFGSVFGVVGEVLDRVGSRVRRPGSSLACRLRRVSDIAVRVRHDSAFRRCDAAMVRALPERRPNRRRGLTRALAASRKCEAPRSRPAAADACPLRQPGALEQHRLQHVARGGEPAVHLFEARRQRREADAQAAGVAVVGDDVAAPTAARSPRASTGCCSVTCPPRSLGVARARRPSRRAGRAARRRGAIANSVSAIDFARIAVDAGLLDQRERVLQRRACRRSAACPTGTAACPAAGTYSGPIAKTSRGAHPALDRLGERAPGGRRAT